MAIPKSLTGPRSVHACALRLAPCAFQGFAYAITRISAQKATCSQAFTWSNLSFDKDRQACPDAPELSKLGINGIIDEGRGVICFSYGLESFDGPTRVLIYDPQHSVHSDYSRWTKGEMPSLTRWTIDDWTYIKNND